MKETRSKSKKIGARGIVEDFKIVVVVKIQ